MGVIDVYCNDGSPIGIIPDDVWVRGVGGAELALVNWAEEMARRGHSLTVYNNPRTAGCYAGVTYCHQEGFRENRPERDVLIVYRSPNKHLRHAKAPLKVFWSMDQYTVGDFAADVFPFVDHTVCISQFHKDYHVNRYGADPAKISVIDLGAHPFEYDLLVKKVPGRLIYCSVPDRGLEVLLRAWPEIRKQRPDASLAITADYTLWGSGNPLDSKHRLQWLNQPGVRYLGAIPRDRLQIEQREAEVHAYPCTYDELFCLAVSECSVAGAYPVTSGVGALLTTNRYGLVVDGDPSQPGWYLEFAHAVCAVMNDPALPSKAEEVRTRASRRFDWRVVVDQWEELLYDLSFAKEGPLP